MTKKTILTLFMLLACTFIAFADDRTDEQRAKDAELIVKSIESKNWIFVVERAETSGLIFEDLRPDDNYFAAREGELNVHLNYFGANVINNMTPHRMRMAFDELRSNPAIRPTNFIEIYDAKLKVIEQKVEVSKNNKNVRVDIRYEVLETNQDNIAPSSNTLQMDISTKDGSATILYSTINFQETYFGSFGKTIYVDK